MLYWMNDETGKVIAREEGDHPGEKWFEISPDDYKANLHPLSRPTQRAADVCPTTADNSLHRWVPDGDNEICLNCGTRR